MGLRRNVPNKVLLYSPTWIYIYIDTTTSSQKLLSGREVACMVNKAKSENKTGNLEIHLKNIGRVFQKKTHKNRSPHF